MSDKESIVYVVAEVEVGVIKYVGRLQTKIGKSRQRRLSREIFFVRRKTKDNDNCMGIDGMRFSTKAKTKTETEATKSKIEVI